LLLGEPPGSLVPQLLVAIGEARPTTLPGFCSGRPCGAWVSKQALQLRF
jgi:hypothetical protein